MRRCRTETGPGLLRKSCRISSFNMTRMNLVVASSPQIDGACVRALRPLPRRVGPTQYPTLHTRNPMPGALPSAKQRQQRRQRRQRRQRQQRRRRQRQRQRPFATRGATIDGSGGWSNAEVRGGWGSRRDTGTVFSRGGCRGPSGSDFRLGFDRLVVRGWGELEKFDSAAAPATRINYFFFF